ncbi:hypothetical protein LAB1_08050 [Roseibium sp. LAB1]
MDEAIFADQQAHFFNSKREFCVDMLAIIPAKGAEFRHFDAATHRLCQKWHGSRIALHENMSTGTGAGNTKDGPDR